MEKLLGMCAALPKEMVEAGERARQAQRRAAAREAAKRQQKAEQVQWNDEEGFNNTHTHTIVYTQERRVQRVLQRAAQPAVKAKGKPLMVRSVVNTVKNGGGARATKQVDSHQDVESYMTGPLLL